MNQLAVACCPSCNRSRRDPQRAWKMGGRISDSFVRMMLDPTIVRMKQWRLAPPMCAYQRVCVRSDGRAHRILLSSNRTCFFTTGSYLRNTSLLNTRRTRMAQGECDAAHTSVCAQALGIAASWQARSIAKRHRGPCGSSTEEAGSAEAASVVVSWLSHHSIAQLTQRLPHLAH